MTMADMEKRQAFYWQIRKDFAAKHGRQPTIREVEREAKAIDDKQKAETCPLVKVVVKATTAKKPEAKKNLTGREGWLEMKRGDYAREYVEATEPKAKAAALAAYNRIVNEQKMLVK